MSERHVDEALRVLACEQQVQAMMTAAANATAQEAKAEFLRLATEWMELAVEISKRLADL